jgi:hypothetical protein
MQYAKQIVSAQRAATQHAKVNYNTHLHYQPRAPYSRYSRDAEEKQSSYPPPRPSHRSGPRKFVLTEEPVPPAYTDDALDPAGSPVIEHAPSFRWDGDLEEEAALEEARRLEEEHDHFDDAGSEDEEHDEHYALMAHGSNSMMNEPPPMPIPTLPQARQAMHRNVQLSRNRY